MSDHRNTRKGYFNGECGASAVVDYLPKEITERWREEARLLECRTCLDRECQFRYKDARLPEDAGGQGQCLRWAKEFTPLAWRNADGRVIIIPQEAVDRLREIL